MASAQDAIRRLTIKTEVQGGDKAKSTLDAMAKSQDGVVASTTRGTAAQSAYDQALAKQQKTLDAVNDRYQKMLRDQTQLAAAQDMTARSVTDVSRAANDNAEQWHLTGAEIAQTANHLKTAAIAAYALSPAFRQMVNPAVTASIRAIGPAATSAAGAALTALTPVLAFAGRLAPPIFVAVEAFKAMVAITELGAQKLKELNDLAGNAAGAGVGTDFFQKQAAGAKEYGTEAGLATAALKKFNDISEPALGGSAFDQRLDQLTKAGNFVNNTGVAALKSAVTAEDRYRGVVDLIDQAMNAGQRLAALDLASKFLPPELMDRLRANGHILTEMQQTADAIKPVDIVSAEQVGYALSLKTRLDDANEIIANGMKPLQKDLTQLGLNYQEGWVNIVELEAKAVSWANDLYGALKGIPDIFARAGNAPFWKQLTDYTEKLGLNSDPASLGLITKGQSGFNEDAARRELNGKLQNPAAITQSMQQTSSVASAVFGDTSIDPASVKASKDANDQVDRAINTLRRHTEQQAADTAAMGLGAGALARFRAEAAETSAIQANGGKITADQAAQFEKLKQQAEDTAIAFERAKIASSIKFSRDTMFLTPEDVQIAQQLKGLYPDVATAIGSVEAAQMRANQQMLEFKNTSAEVAKSFAHDMLAGKSAAESFGNVLQTLSNKLLDKTIDAGINALFGGGGGGSWGTLFNRIFSANGNVFANDNLVPFANGDAFTNTIVNRPTAFAFANGGALGVMGEAGPEAIMPLARGANGKLGVANHGNSGQQQIVTNTYVTNNFTGTDAQLKAWVTAQNRVWADKTLRAAPGVVAKANRDTPSLRRSSAG